MLLEFHIIFTTTLYSVLCTGMCMCTSMYMEPASGMVYVFGGFEDGSVVLWDGRFSHKELASMKLFPEPGMGQPDISASLNITNDLLYT